MAAEANPDYDVVCVGFGATALALATALADRNTTAKILFIDREKKFTWRPAEVLPDKAVAASFLHDLVTEENPRSQYTMLNYLYSDNQIVRFANNSTIRPTRLLLGCYFGWVAEQIQRFGWTSYGQEVVQVKPFRHSQSGRVSQWTVTSRDVETGQLSNVRSKRLVVATGTQPYLPDIFSKPDVQRRVAHASACGSLLGSLDHQQEQLQVAVIGAGQEAAEIFEHLHTAPGKHHATLFLPDAAPVPTTHSNLSLNTVVGSSDPNSLPPEIRDKMVSSAAPSTPTVSSQTMEHIYSLQYENKIRSRRGMTQQQFDVQFLSEIVGVGSASDGKVRLELRNPQTGLTTFSPQSFDHVIAATGYESTVQKQLLRAILSLLEEEKLTVDRQYHLNFRRGALAPGCGAWLLGSLEDCNDRKDDFTHLAERAGRAARSLLASMAEEKRGASRPDAQAML